MKTIHGVRELDKFGIDPLTGEACQIGMRILCDLTPQGAAIIKETLGLPADCVLAENWNSRGVASILLPYAWWKQVAIVALFRGGAKSVAEFTDHVMSFDEGDDPEQWQDSLNYQRESLIRTYTPLGHPGTQLGCQHAMTGRAQ